MYSRIISFIKLNPFKFLVIIFGLLVLKEIIYIQTFRNEVSPIADGYSEANTTRGGVFFFENGVTSFSGLPDILYGDLLLDKGSVPLMKAQGEIPHVAYTHYPPGPEYMAWIGYHIVGKGNFNALRFLPILLSVLAGYFFLSVNFGLLGGGIRGLIFSLMLILPPMFSNFMHGLHHQQYSFLLFQTQMALAILFCTKEVRKPLYLISFLLLGFFQGYLTFDYAFLASLFIIPFYIYFAAPFFTLVGIGLASGISFTAAHLLHFYQVVNYYGDVQKALADFTDSAAHRSHNAEGIDKANPKYNPKEIGPFTVMRDYLYRVAGRGKYLSVNLMNFIWIIIGLKFIKRITFKKGWTFEFSMTGRDLSALAAAVIISSMWSLVMKQHAHIHGFIARHYFFAYYFCCLIFISRTKRIQ